MPKRKLNDELSRRFKTEEKVEVQDPLAAAIQASKDAEKQEDTYPSPDVPQPEGTQEGKDARMHARTKGSEQESTSEDKPVSPPERKQTRKQVLSTARKQERQGTPEEAYIGKGVIRNISPMVHSVTRLMNWKS